MKKSLFLTCILMGAAVISFVFALIWVNSGKEEILIIEEVLYGDPSEAAGLTLKIPIHWRGRLLWDTEYTIGGGREAESKFTFSSREIFWQKEEAETEVGIQMVYANSIGADFNGYSTYPDWGSGSPYKRMIQSVEEKTEKGKKLTEAVRIIEYDSSYPLDFEMSVGHSVWFQGDFSAALRYLTGYFHISPAEDRMEVTVEKDETGEVVSVRCGMAESDESFFITSAAADGGEGIYYVYCLQNVKTGETVDRGQNRGIFYFPYEEDEGNYWNLDLTQVSRVSDFPEDAIPLKMRVSREDETLCLAVREQEGYSLFIYRLEGKTPVLAQQIPVDRNNLSGNMAYLKEIEDSRMAAYRDAENVESGVSAGGSSSSGSTASGWAQMEMSGSESRELPEFRQMYLEEGGILMTWSDSSFSFVAGEGGEYRWWCDDVFPKPGEEEYYGRYPFPTENVCIFDGERLTLAAYESWYSLNAVVAVYSRAGQTYAGRYLHSLNGDRDMGTDPYYDSYDSITLRGYREKPYGYYWRSGSRTESIKPLSVIKGSFAED